jgi:hypothetical protein
MVPTVLFVITSDPRTSPKPAEAIRIAAGVGAWKKSEVSIYLRGAAILALSEFPDDLVDSDNFARYLPIVGEWRRPVYVQRGVTSLRDIGQTALMFKEINDIELAELLAKSAYVLTF